VQSKIKSAKWIRGPNAPKCAAPSPHLWLTSATTGDRLTSYYFTGHDWELGELRGVAKRNTSIPTTQELQIFEIVKPSTISSAPQEAAMMMVSPLTFF